MTDTAGLIRTLEDSGLRRQAAHAIASALEEQRRRSSGGVPPWALILVAGLVAGVIGFLATITLENRERLTRVEEKLQVIEEGQQALKEGQRELVQRVGAVEEGQRELMRRVGALEEGQQEMLRLLRRQ